VIQLITGSLFSSFAIIAIPTCHPSSLQGSADTRIKSKNYSKPLQKMKSTKLLTGFLAATLATPAIGQTFQISGATAFRRGTIESVHALFVASNQPFRFGSNRAGTDYVNADLVIWEGTIAGNPTTVRTSFNGSIEGLRALAIAESPGADPRYYLPSVLTVTPIAGGAQQDGDPTTAGIQGIPNNTTTTQTATTDIAFSDTDKAISPYAADQMVGGQVGVAVFGLVTSQGSPITNVTVQQYNSLLENGKVPLKFFTGNPADNSLVFCTGRNDGSGTRSSYLAEMGYGVSNPVNQYLVISREGVGFTDQIRAIQRVPAGGVNDSDPVASGVQLPLGSDIRFFHENVNPIAQLTSSRSIVWGNDIDGNGGASSGSGLREDLGRAGASVTVFNPNGSLEFATPQTNISLLSWISLNDAVTARGLGASIVAFNGVKLDVNANSTGVVTPGGAFMSTADKEKCYNGMYSAWNFQQMYYRDGSDQPVIDLYNLIFNAVPNNLGAAGLRTVDMKVGRTDDGGTMNPIF
jgi:hypothetical protein